MIEPAVSDGRFLEDVESVAGDGRRLHLWWLGQSGYLVQWGPWRLLIDPYLSDSLTAKYARTDKPHVRMTRRVVAPEALEDISFVTASHAHTDHLDPDTLRALRTTNHPTFVAPHAVQQVAAERWGGYANPIVFMNAGESQIWGDVAVRAVPAAHETIERDADGNCQFLGYVFKLGPHTIYHSGDTVLYSGMVEELRPHGIDIALLPINGRAPERRVAGNLNGREAAWLAKEIGAKLVIPCHYDMFEFNTADPRDQFIPECERLGQPYKVLRAGERWSSE